METTKKLSRAAWLFGALVLLAQGACAPKAAGDAGTEAPPPPSSGPGATGGDNNRASLEQVATFPKQVTGVAVSKTGRIFVNFPRWSDRPDVSVGEVDGSGKLVPYPDATWNSWDGTKGTAAVHFVCVQAVFVDDRDMLWIVDPAAPNMGNIVQGGPKLVQVDLSTNQVVRFYPLDLNVAPQNSYLNDVRISPDHQWAYLTESGTGALVVLNLDSGVARRVLDNHASTKAEDLQLVVNNQPLKTENGQRPRINVDGIALSADGTMLYYHALTGQTLYRVPTWALTDPNLTADQVAAQVQTVAQTPPTDGMWLDGNGDLLLSDFQNNAVTRYTLSGNGSLQTVAKDDQLQWPDTFAMDPQGRIYVTASQINLQPRFNNGAERFQRPFKLFRFKP